MRWEIIKLFSSKNVFGFTFMDVTLEFPEKNPAYLGRILAEMVDKGMLFKITRDNYHIIPLNEDPRTYVPDRHQVAKYIMQHRQYYIAYASALEIHGVKSNSGSREYIVTKKQQKPTVRIYGEIAYQFIHHAESRFFGFRSFWINHHEKAMVSDLEKTLVDIATKPQLCGGIIEVGNAIFQSKNLTDRDKLFYYFSRNLNKSAKKRFLFLTKILGLEWTVEHERMMHELGPGIPLLDPTAPDQGRKRSKFGLKINVDPLFIKEAILNKERT